MMLGRNVVSRRAAALLLGVTAAVMLAFVAVFALHHVMPLDELKKFVDIGAESNLPAWWNAVLLFLVAGLAAAAALWQGGSRVGAAWWIIAAAAAYLSLDETAGLHERLARPTVAAGIETPTYPWLALGVVVAGAGAFVLFLAGRMLPWTAYRPLAVALVLYALGAVGTEAFNGWVRGTGPGLLFSAGLIVEEGLEMLAAIVAVVAVLDYLVDGLRLSQRSARHPPGAGPAARGSGRPRPAAKRAVPGRAGQRAA
ncbi:hypothetical protein ACFQ36_13185 [Arthrobacter sp. GCM10027362]|uniref:hypothetical protein n=1 Tax=Arthrobacter sp. GCM10027362 TaxID=3273379 RepID=UPI003628ED41